MPPVEIIEEALKNVNKRNWGAWDLNQIFNVSAAVVRAILKRPKRFDPELVMDLEILVSDFLEELSLSSTPDDIRRVAGKAERAVRARLAKATA